MSELIDNLREMYKTLSADQKPILSEAVNELKTLAEYKAVADNPLPEAGASVNFRMVDPTTQLEIQFTMREHSRIALANGVQEMYKYFAALGFISFDAYVDQRRAEREADRAERIEFDQTYQGNGQLPICTIHKKEMKQSKYGGWFCPVKIAEDDGAGKPVYCKQKMQ